MARAARKIPHAKLASKVIKRHLLGLAKVLELIGHPTFLFFKFTILLFIITSSIFGRILRQFWLKSTKFSKLQIKRLAKRSRRGKSKKLPKPTILFPFGKAVWAIGHAANLIFSQLFSLVTKINFRLVLVCLILYALILAPVSFFVYVLDGLPSPEMLLTRKLEVSTKIYDRNGVLLYKIYKDKNRTVVPLNKIPTQVRLATLAAEDAEFYDHPGISFRGIFRSTVRNISRGELTGGSTITQQLVKNALLTPEKTFVRKAREIILALQVETAFTKDEILEMYLNEVSYGGTSYGIQEAAVYYFDKDVGNLTLAEAALLAGLPKRPSQLSNPENALARQKQVLELMQINGFINDSELAQALSTEIKLQPKTDKIRAPHFVMYVREYLEAKYGEAVVNSGGLEVITTLDSSVQTLAEQVLETELAKVKNLKVGNGGIVVLNPATGEILAMVGSRNYFDIANDGNVNVTLAPRSPGSSIKVVTYAYALTSGLTAATMLDDSPITYRIPGQPDYSPKNYDSKYRGKITLRSALAESRNIPAVKTLASFGTSKIIDQGRKMGITTWNTPSRFGLSLTLGGGETRLIDMAGVYATIANSGKKPAVSPIVKVADYKGTILEKNNCAGDNPNCIYDQVLDPRVAYILTDILKDNKARTPAFGNHSQLVITGHPEVAVKTGTSNDLRDNLTIGFNQKYLVAVWVGNNDNSPMARIASGVTGAAPIFNKVMTGLIKDTPSLAWQAPPGLIQLSICSTTGTLACSNCATGSEWFFADNKLTNSCNPETVKRIRQEKDKLTGSEEI